MNKEEIARRVNSFPVWGMYQFNLQGVLTPITDPNTPYRTLQRKNYFFDPLVAHFGGSLKGKRVLDIACNAGYWSLQAVEHGCDYVVGVDGRQMHIDQANFVFSVHDVDTNRYKFVRGNVFDVDFRTLGEFDIVFCLGFFHHVNKQMQLLEKIAQVNRDVLVLETRISRIPGPYMVLMHESTDLHVNALDHSLTMIPTKQAVFQMVEQVGYDVVMLQPQAEHRAGVPEYRWDRRRAFFCARTSDLSRLSARVERNGLYSELKDILALGAHWLIRRAVWPKTASQPASRH